MDTISHCIEALQGAMMLTAQAIQVEIAVSFIVFYEQGDTDIQAKKVLRQVYASAGRVDCLTSGTGSYGTVTRRMGRCAAFYDTLGKRKLKTVVNGKQGKAAIDAVIAFIKPYEIETMDDLAAHAARPRVPKPAPVESSRATDFVETVIHIETEHVHIDVTPEATKEELLAAIKALRDRIKEL